jgi:hypothetical protein
MMDGATTTRNAEPGGVQPLLVLENVDKRLGDLRVLHDVNLTLRRGEVLVIIGPSGVLVDKDGHIASEVAVGALALLALAAGQAAVPLPAWPPGERLPSGAVQCRIGCAPRLEGPHRPGGLTRFRF